MLKNVPIFPRPSMNLPRRIKRIVSFGGSFYLFLIKSQFPVEYKQKSNYFRVLVKKFVFFSARISADFLSRFIQARISFWLHCSARAKTFQRRKIVNNIIWFRSVLSILNQFVCLFMSRTAHRYNGFISSFHFQALTIPFFAMFTRSEWRK